MAYRVIIHCPDAEDIIRLLKETHGALYSRVWRINSHTIGVFSFECTIDFFHAGHVSLIVLEHDKISERCEATVMFAGGGIPSLDSATRADDPTKRAVKGLVSLARERDWEVHAEEAKIKFRGSQCPSCGSVYIYSMDKIQVDGSVVCQNCGKPFTIQEE